MKVLKFKDSGDVLAIADEVEEVSMQPTKIKIVPRKGGGKIAYEVDEYGNETLRGTFDDSKRETEVVDVEGTIEAGKAYEVKNGKLIIKK